MRIELINSVLAGLAGGLAGTLWSGLVSAPLLSRQPALRSLGWVPDSGMRVLGTAIVYGACGAAAGLLFWLGWGLIAIVGQPWFVVGPLFGVLAWVAVAMPALGTLLLQGYGSARAIAAHALEWLFTCLGVGLLCALAWHRYA